MLQVAGGLRRQAQARSAVPVILFNTPAARLVYNFAVMHGAISTVVTREEARRIVAANLQDVADQKGVQQADIARAIRRSDEELQTARQRVYRYFNARADIVGDDLANIADFLGVSVARILDCNAKKKSRKAN